MKIGHFHSRKRALFPQVQKVEGHLPPMPPGSAASACAVSRDWWVWQNLSGRNRECTDGLGNITATSINKCSSTIVVFYSRTQAGKLHVFPWAFRTPWLFKLLLYLCISWLISLVMYASACVLHEWLTLFSVIAVLGCHTLLACTVCYWWTYLCEPKVKC